VGWWLAGLTCLLTVLWGLLLYYVALQICARRRFVKLCREAGLIDGRFSTTAADLVFAKVKTKVSSSRAEWLRCSYHMFLCLWSHVAAGVMLPF
jgi:hypothetical protein